MLCNVRQYWTMVEALKGKERGKASPTISKFFCLKNMHGRTVLPCRYEVVGPEGFEPPTKRL